MRLAISLISLSLLASGCGSSSSGGGGGLGEALPDISSKFGGFGDAEATDGAGGVTATDAAGGPDSGLTDGGVLDVGLFDTGAPDTGAPDTSDPDTGTPDTGAPDTSAPDTGTPDTGTPDTGAGACGDGTCGATESCQTCPADCGVCPANCGNGKCDADENCKTCSKDCGVCPAGCGDGTCNAATENCQTCSLDCGKCPALCGDKSCNGTETCKDCPADCGVCPGGCGDGKCDAGTEDCKSCSADCGQCPGLCEPLTSKGCSAAQQCYPTTTSAACGNPGTLQENAPCTSTTACAKGMLCVGTVCKKLCDSSGSNVAYACPGAGKCTSLNYSDGKPVGFNLGTCTEFNKCKLPTDVGCASNQTCDFVKEGSLCLPTGTKTNGQACNGLDECVKGYMCLGNPMVCRKKCVTTGGSPSCGSGVQCLTVTIDSKGTPAPDKLGVCNK